MAEDRNLLEGFEWEWDAEREMVVLKVSPQILSNKNSFDALVDRMSEIARSSDFIQGVEAQPRPKKSDSKG